MSQFNKKGYRKDNIRNQVKHLNSFYEILDKLEDIYQKMINKDHEIITHDNIDYWSEKYMKRPLDSIELMVLKGKLGLETKKLEDGPETEI